MFSVRAEGETVSNVTSSAPALRMTHPRSRLIQSIDVPQGNAAVEADSDDLPRRTGGHHARDAEIFSRFLLRKRKGFDNGVRRGLTQVNESDILRSFEST